MTTAQVLLTLLTITMSGVVAAVVTSRLNARHEERQFHRKWLEQLYGAFTGFCAQLEVHWLHYMHVMVGTIDHNQAVDLTIAATKDELRHFQNVEMLVTIYWPQFDPFLAELKLLRERANDILDTHKRRYLDGQRVDRQSYETLRGIGESLDVLRDRFHDQVREIARSLR